MHRLEYQRSRRNSRSGYIDRLIERVRLKQPDTDLGRSDIDSLFDKQNEKCALSGLPFQYDLKIEGAVHNPLAPSIDKIDPHGGYFKRNVQLLADFVNRAGPLAAQGSRCSIPAPGL